MAVHKDVIVGRDALGAPSIRQNWLDARLGAVAAFVDEGAELVADIGADHGRLACALLATRPGLRMIVADISADSLAKARRLLERRGLSHRAEFRVANGLGAIQDGERPDVIVLAGLGGATLRDILAAEGAKNVIGNAKLILQPNIEAPLLRGWLCANGFPLIDETVVQANGRYYVILCARQGEARALTPKERALGPCLLAKKPPEYAGYLRWREQVLTRALAQLCTARERDAAREAEIAQEIAWIKEITSASPCGNPTTRNMPPNS
ncbi:MAG: tRNA (adenine(22)-N(1))-methyltransferase TrmK [Clostridia bacterium]|nr:tRNA (adenine(22)-N(1))-methyltransferase TrmK [Clostridia bacterium]